MSPPPIQTFLFSPPSLPSGTVLVNDRVKIQTQDDIRVVTVDGLAMHRIREGDRALEAYAMVTLADAGHADQNDVARAFGCTPRTVRRDQTRFEEEGLHALGRSGGRPRGRGASGSMACFRERTILRLKKENASNREIARRLGMSEKAVRKRLRRLGWTPSVPQGALFGSAPAPSSGAPAKEAKKSPEVAAQIAYPSMILDEDPMDRRMDRALAALGRLEDATPRFAKASRVQRAGVLLAIPAIVASGVLSVAKEVYRHLAPAFYGLRTTVLSLIALSLLRIKRPEALKEYAPPDLGRILGLDRTPDVKTLRRKLAILAARGKAVAFGRELARRRLKARKQLLGFLYVDGHVRVYHGKRTIPKAHIARMRLSAPAVTDYWVNDLLGNPVFVVTAEANTHMVQMLPKILQEIRGLVGGKRRITIVFDRGGFSPRLFREMIRDGFDILTYRKGRSPPVPKRRFILCKERIEGRPVEYFLNDRMVRLDGGRLRLRQVTKLDEKGHQTPILTSRTDLLAAVVAYRMFERWRQENFFKYGREEFALDALTDYQVEPDDPNRIVPNPAWRKADKALKAAEAELAKLQQALGVAVLENPEGKRPTVRGFKVAQRVIGRKIREVEERLILLRAGRELQDRRVPIGEALQGEPVVRLAVEKKHLTNVLKMVAYQIESVLFELLWDRYARNEQEGRTLVAAALQSAADIEPAGNELRVTLAPQSAPHRTRVVAALCEELNRTETCFPGTQLRMRFGVAQPPP